MYCCKRRSNINQEYVAVKNNGPFRSCIRKINDTLI